MSYHISRVRAKGFKSVGKHWLHVELKEGLNAIVGPNGAGKSTVLEAICFAFAAPVSTFGRGLHELRSTGCSEVRCMPRSTAEMLFLCDVHAIF